MGFLFIDNDDTELFEDCLEELLKTHTFCLQKQGKPGLYSGATCAKSDQGKTTYGGNIITNRFYGEHTELFLMVLLIDRYF